MKTPHTHPGVRELALQIDPPVSQSDIGDAMLRDADELERATLAKRTRLGRHKERGVWIKIATLRRKAMALQELRP